MGSNVVQNDTWVLGVTAPVLPLILKFTSVCVLPVNPDWVKAL